MPRSHFVAVIVVALAVSACAGPALRPRVSPSAPHADALLILPGLGYGREDGAVFRSIAASAAADGIDVYVPPYLTRTGLDGTRAKLQAYIRGQHLERYERLHVFAFIAGAWAFNPLVAREDLPNLKTVVYDRSPLQERAPAIAAEALPVRAWLRFGTTIFDLARTPYPALSAPDVRVALLVETKPTRFIERHDKGRPALTFNCDALGQRYDDCERVAMNHDDIYARFGELWPAVEAFIQTGRLRR